jgi:hypothetical protein
MVTRKDVLLALVQYAEVRREALNLHLQKWVGLKNKLRTLLLIYVGGALSIVIHFWGSLPNSTWGLAVLFIVGPPIAYLIERWFEKRHEQTSKKSDFGKFMRMAGATTWSLLVWAIGWPSLILPGGEFWWSGMAVLASISIVPWAVIWIVSRRNKSKDR